MSRNLIVRPITIIRIFPFSNIFQITQCVCFTDLITYNIRHICKNTRVCGPYNSCKLISKSLLNRCCKFTVFQFRWKEKKSINYTPGSCHGLKCRLALFNQLSYDPLYQFTCFIHNIFLWFLLQNMLEIRGCCQLICRPTNSKFTASCHNFIKYFSCFSFFIACPVFRFSYKAICNILFHFFQIDSINLFSDIFLKPAICMCVIAKIYTIFSLRLIQKSLIVSIKRTSNTFIKFC